MNGDDLVGKRLCDIPEFQDGDTPLDFFLLTQEGRVRRVTLTLKWVWFLPHVFDLHKGREPEWFLDDIVRTLIAENGWTYTHAADEACWGLWDMSDLREGYEREGATSDYVSDTLPAFLARQKVLEQQWRDENNERRYWLPATTD